ncbi:MAG: DUF2460 domain-containing protein [Hyphomicrobiaceae bacterium]
MTFHEVRFPTDISRGATGGPERRTDVVVLGSGHEERNSRWADSRRFFNAGYGVRSVDDLQTIVQFFEERRGRLYGFRWKDHADFKSGLPLAATAPTDQSIGTGDGSTSVFQLTKTYGGALAPYSRDVTKPVAGTVKIAVDGAIQNEGSDYMVDTSTGLVTFFVGSVPFVGAVVSAGFEFDVPVRFDSDRLEINLRSFEHGAIPSIPIVEVRL